MPREHRNIIARYASSYMASHSPIIELHVTSTLSRNKKFTLNKELSIANLTANGIKKKDRRFPPSCLQKGWLHRRINESYHNSKKKKKFQDSILSAHSYTILPEMLIYMASKHYFFTLCITRDVHSRRINSHSNKLALHSCSSTVLWQN